MVGRGTVLPGMAGPGWARLGEAWLGRAGHGMAGLLLVFALNCSGTQIANCYYETCRGPSGPTTCVTCCYQGAQPFCEKTCR